LLRTTFAFPVWGNENSDLETNNAAKAVLPRRRVMIGRHVGPVTDRRSAGSVVSQQFLDAEGEEGAESEVEQLFFWLELQDQRVAGFDQRA